MLGFDKPGVVDIPLIRGVIRAESPYSPIRTVLPTENAFRKALIEALQDFFRFDPVTEDYRWFQEEDTVTVGVNKMHITDHYVDDIQWFPCAVVSGVTWTEIPVSFRNFLCEYTDDFGVWRRYGAQVQCTATITVGAMRGGEAEYLKSLVDFGLKEPIRKIMDNKGYRTLLNTIAPGQIGQRKVAGTEVNMYWGDQRVSYISMWSRDYLEGMETIQSITVDQTASEEE